jgi:Glycosyltransferase family 87
MFMLSTTPRLLGYRGDISVYQRWYDCCFAHVAFPSADAMWQYPPGAAVVFWLPGAVPGSYLHNFVFLALVCDLAVLVLLARRARSLAGAWYWVCGVPLVGSIELTRFDVVPVALSVAALCLAGTAAADPGRIRGALIGAGAAVKLWPVMLLAGTPPGQWRRTAGAAATVAGVICVLLIGGAPSFVGHQNARGVEIESVVATPFMIWRQAGWHGRAVFQFGAMELRGTEIAVAQDVSLVGLVLAVALVIGWRLLIRTGRAWWRPEFATDAPLAATLLFLVANSVLSPQYLLWVIGLAAVCLAVGAGGTTQRPVAFMLLGCAGLTQIVHPIGWKSLVHGSDLLTGVLFARNLLLLAAAIVSCWLIFRASRRPVNPRALSS